MKFFYDTALGKNEAKCLTDEHCSDCGSDGKCKACDASYKLSNDGICYYEKIAKCLSGHSDKYCTKCEKMLYLNIATVPNVCETKCPDTSYPSRGKCWPGIQYVSLIKDTPRYYNR